MRIVLIFLFILAVLTDSCTYAHRETVPCALPDTVSFSRDIQPIFTTHCNEGVDCHSGSRPGGNLNLEPGKAYAELDDPGSGYLDTIKPRFSLLYAQMISVSMPMPPTGNLDDCTTDLVLKWMEQKAKNN